MGCPCAYFWLMCFVRALIEALASGPRVRLGTTEAFGSYGLIAVRSSAGFGA